MLVIGLNLVTVRRIFAQLSLRDSVFCDLHHVWGRPAAFNLGLYASLPMVALAVAELGCVPLASVLFYRHKLTQIVALFGLIAGYLALEKIGHLALNELLASTQ
jgi:hypothetical protein